MNITVSEWEDRTREIAEQIKARWPWLHRPMVGPGEIGVSSEMLRARADLRWISRVSGVVRIIVDSSACLSGELLDICSAVQQMSEVRDAMLFVYGQTAHLSVWADGECPCSYCSGRGTTQGSECSRCGGKGKR